MADVYPPEFPSGAGAGRARVPEPPPITERSVIDIVKDIVANVQEIIRSEVRLATVEMREKAAQTGKAGAMLAAGVVVGLYGIGFLLAGIYNAIATALPAWASALIVGGVLAIIAGGMIGAGRKRLKQVNPTPQQTVASVKENVEWIKSQTK